jgi:hypothetical protein
MSQYLNRKSITAMFFALALAIGLLGVNLQHASAAPARSAAPKVRSATGTNPFCSRLGKNIQASSGAQMYCFGSQPNGPSHAAPTTNPSFGSNVDAANPHEDVAPNGTQAYGQSEVSIAGVGPYVAEEWNDATGFFAPCPSPKFKEELSGYGFSANGGASFTDQGGLPNDCTTNFKLFGDPSVESWRSGGTAYFYFSSLYINTVSGQSDLALNACKATGTGTSGNLACSLPVIMAQGGPGDFLDKEFLTIDPKRGRLYASFTRFGAVNTPTANGQIELAVCDIGTATGGTGPAGGTAGTPVCFPDSSPVPYFVVAPAHPSCENEGAYPAVNVKTGDVYVAWEFNWATSFEVPACASVRVQNKIAYVPFACLTLTPTSPCTTTPLTDAVNITSMSAAFVPGYNRFPANDFPRIAVSDKFGTVSITWNDARYHPLGDILLQSFILLTPTATSFTGIQGVPVRLNTQATGGLHFLPALRRSDDEGNLSVSWYQRSSPNTALTNVVAAINVNPRTTSTPGSNTLVTTGPSNWFNVSSDIIPNFGDYTDNYIMATPSAPYTNDLLYVAWSDGRLGLPQPFEAHGFS